MQEINISYNQLAVFYPSVQNPFNDWNDELLKQSISCRLDSACFEMYGDGIYKYSITDNKLIDKDISEFSRIYLVPFGKPLCEIELASIYESKIHKLGSDYYSYYYLLRPTEFKIILSKEKAELKIVKLDKQIPAKLITNSKPAS